MHSHSIMMFIAVMTAFTAGFVVCKYNLEELQKIYRSIKQRVYKS